MEGNTMGNILDKLIPEHRVQMIVEGCSYHDHKYMTEDGICLKCEDLAIDLLGEVAYFETD